MKKVLIGLLVLSSLSSFAKEVCSVSQSRFEDFLIRCSNQSEDKRLMKKLRAMKYGSKNDVTMIQMMLDEEYDLKTASDVVLNEEFSSTWIFVK